MNSVRTSEMIEKDLEDIRKLEEEEEERRRLEEERQRQEEVMRREEEDRRALEEWLRRGTKRERSDDDSDELENDLGGHSLRRESTTFNDFSDPYTTYYIKPKKPKTNDE